MSGNNYSTARTPKQPVVDVPSAIANYCGRGEQNGYNWKCNCPICGRHALTITYGQKIPLLLRCWHCRNTGLNDGFTEQRKLFIEAGLLEPDAQAIKHFSAEERAEYQAGKREAARCRETRFAVKVWRFPRWDWMRE